MDRNFLTFIATRSLAGLTSQTFERALRVLMPDWIETVERAGAPGGETSIFRINGFAVALLMVPGPLPPDSWAEAARRSLLFKDAPAAMRKTSAHIVVASLDHGTDPRAAIGAAKAVTLAAAAAAMVTEAEAVVFTWSQMILQTPAVIEGARAIDRGALPVLFWTSLQFFGGEPPEAAGSIGAVTTGMIPFIGREIEFGPSVIETPKLAERVLNLCHYLLTQGAVIRDGETIGQTQDERIRASERAEGKRPGIPVLHFAFEALNPPPPAQGPIPFTQPITPAARFAAMPPPGERVFGKRRWTGS